jgi:hypothetical protein
VKEKEDVNKANDVLILFVTVELIFTAENAEKRIIRDRPLDKFVGLK